MCITRCERVCVVRVQLKEMNYICYIFLKKKQFFDLFSYNIITVFLVCFKVLFSSIQLFWYFISFPSVPQSTIIMYCLHVNVSMCINMYTHGYIVQCIKK